MEIIVDNKKLICTRCKIAFTPKRSNNQKYCTIDCHNAHQRENKINNRMWLIHNDTPTKTHCKQCKSSFMATRGMKYCSYNCQRKYGAEVKKVQRKPQTFNCICIECNKQFKNHFLTTFCCDNCKSLHNSKHTHKNIGDGICIHCGISYSKKSNNAAQRFCCLQCYWEYRRLNPDKKIQSNQHTKNRINKICLYCNNSFQVHPYRKDAEFCTKKCHYDYRRYTKHCKTCGKTFNTPKHLNADYCCLECAAKGCGKRKSKLSIFLCNLLTLNNILHVVESPIKSSNRTVWADIMIDNKIVIEGYGDYWHCNPSIYSGDYYHTQVQKTASDIWKYDDDRKKYIESNGYFCIIVWESDISEITFHDNFIKTLKEIICNLTK